MMWQAVCVLWLTLIYIGLCQGRDMPDFDRVDGDNGALGYLSKYGYADGNSIGSLPDALRDFQRMAHIRVTGKFDKQTQRMMNKPRCGFKDEKAKRGKRYVHAPTKWNKMKLKYRITRYTNKLDPHFVDQEIAKAFDFWARVTPLHFYKTETGPIDIEIQFGDFYHGDDYPFDGVGRTLAHAFYPSDDPNYKLSGDAHFDNSEVWTINEHRGTNLLYVAVHEFGHSLGLGHSTVKGAIMWPWAGGYDPNLKLHDDDIAGIQAHYGGSDKPAPRTTPRPVPRITTTTRRPSVPTNGPTKCSRKLTAITLAANKKIYGFKDDKVYQLKPNGVGLVPGFPKPIYEIFPDGPKKVDAALTVTMPSRYGDRTATFLFQGRQSWMYDEYDGGLDLAPGFPMYTERSWGVDASFIDAAFYWNHDRSVYFISGNDYWRVEANRRMYSGYPKKVSEHPVFSNIRKIDGVFSWNHKNYIFSGDNYYKYYRKSGSRVSLVGPYNTGEFWFKCKGGKHDISQGTEKTVDFGNAGHSTLLSGHKTLTYLIVLLLCTIHLRRYF